MTRTAIWFYLACGGIAYQVVKYQLGFGIKADDALDCAYWAGVALLWHWYSNLKTAE